MVVDSSHQTGDSRFQIGIIRNQRWIPSVPQEKNIAKKWNKIYVEIFYMLCCTDRAQEALRNAS